MYRHIYRNGEQWKFCNGKFPTPQYFTVNLPIPSGITFPCSQFHTGIVPLFPHTGITSPWQGDHSTGKTGKIAKKNPLHGKLREFEKFSKTQGKHREKFAARRGNKEKTKNNLRKSSLWDN